MNPSFEEHYSCDFGISNIWECKDVFNPAKEFLPSTSDYFNRCMTGPANVPYPSNGYQQPKSGDAYVGFYVTASNAQEYVQIKLANHLVANVKYDFSFHVNLSNLSKDATDDIHVKFVHDSVQFQDWPHEIFFPDWVNEEGNYLTDTVSWTRLSGSFIAKGGEEWIIVGSFYGVDNVTVQQVYPDNVYQAYYFLDELTLTEHVLTIPNIFTPNDDGVNDLWEVDAEIDKVVIYNRWGDEVYSSGSEFSGWNGNHKNGSPCTSGVYYYLVTGVDKANGLTEMHKGYLTLLR